MDKGGRPLKQTVDYFPHFVKASAGKTLFILESQFGNDGYAFWFKLLELLGETAGHSFSFAKQSDWDYLLARVKIPDGEKIKKMLTILADDNAIDPELLASKIIWSDRFVQHLRETVYSRRRDESVPVKPSPLNNPPIIKTKGTKVKESKDNPPSDTLSVDNKPVNVDNKPVNVDNNLSEEHKGEENVTGTGSGKNGKTEYEPDVFLKVEEYQKLVEKFGEKGTKERIEKLSLYIGSKGLQNKYKDHYKTILNWEKMDEKKGVEVTGGTDQENPGGVNKYAAAIGKPIHH